MRICRIGFKIQHKCTQIKTDLRRYENYAKKKMRLLNSSKTQTVSSNSMTAMLVIFLLLISVSYSFSADSFRKSGSQSSITMPSSPSMPSLSTPSIGSGFYAPGSKDFYSRIQSSNQNQKSSATSSKSQTSDDSNSSSDSSSKSAPQNDSSQNQNSSSSDSNLLSKTVSSVDSAASNLNLLTAGDLSAMNGLGLFSTVSGLLQNQNQNSAANQLNSSILINQNSSDSKKLEQILSELSEIKSQNASSDGDLPQNQNGFSSSKKVEPKILRFIVNGYDILSTCKKIYFSEQESDGTFLLTGDRKYLSANKSRSETFYFFFHTKGSEGGITKYCVTPAVSQDYENKYSFLYQLTQKSELEAERTGNLVTLRASDGSWKMDLLISM